MRARPRFRSIVPLVVGFLLLGLIVLGNAWLAERQERSVAGVRHRLDVQIRLGTVLS